MKIVSLTITEKGYCWDKAGNLDVLNPLIINDVANIDRPASALGYILAAVLTHKIPPLPHT